MKKSKLVSSSFFFVSIFVFYFFIPLEIDNKIAGQEAYAEKFQELSLKERRDSYFAGNTSVYRTDKNIKILIVPGHDDEYHGTEFEGVREVDLNRELGNHLYDLLKPERGFTVAKVSDEDGYTRLFQKFFDRNEKDIKKFIKKSQRSFKNKVKDGDIEYNGSTHHNKAPEEVAKRLYGINLWAEENDFDLVIHIHFNDYAGRYKDKNPKYNGFSIYVPEKQLENHKISYEFAENIFNRISKYSPGSNLPLEEDGIIETQELIAIGSNETLEDTAAVLIEYGYIYEKQFTNPDIRPMIMKDLARQTYLGIKDYFGEQVSEEKVLHLEDLYKRDLFYTLQNYELQKKLASLNYYPPEEKTFNECPVSGLFSECTYEAVKKFQKDNNLPSTGYVGPMTRKILNSN